MKHIIIYSFFCSFLLTLWGCKKDNYPGAVISPYIAIYDIRNIYKGNDVTLTKENMFGSGKLAAMVVSDHSGGNLPEGLLIVQDARRLSQLRGISIQLGADAASFVPGDSVIIDVEGAVLKKVDGILEITGVTKNAITKVSSGNALPLNRVTVDVLLANPDKYESTFSVVVKGGFDPLPGPTDVLSGDKTLTDGFGALKLHTESSAAFANTPMPVLANFYGIFFNTTGQLGPHFRLRKGDDVVVLSSTIEIPPVVITGFMSFPFIPEGGNDGNYEYIQFMATRDIDFFATPFSVVTTNNANAATPTGYPANGWATGGVRSYKFNLTSGRAAKGTFFYVGGTAKVINGQGSTSISSSNWIRSYNYASNAGEGFGNKTTNLLANSGNASGAAIFEGTNVTVASRPVDVVFVGTGGSLYDAGVGYRITNTDFYDLKNPITLEDQPFYRSGSNTLAFTYNSPRGIFYKLGGEYKTSLGRWTKVRTQTNVQLTASSALTEIEGEGATKLIE